MFVSFMPVFLCVVAVIMTQLTFDVVDAFKFPPEIKRCPVGDTDCIQAVTNGLLKSFASGSTGIHLVPLDPLEISEIKLKQGHQSPVNIELNFQNVELTGLSDYQIYKISGFQEDPVGEYEIRLKGPVLHLIGPYTISGRVLILPIQGEGKSNMTLVTPDLHIKFTGKTETRNGKEYLTTDNLKLTFTISRLYMNLENLYKGDKALGDSTNQFLNENWKEIYGELEPLIFDAFTLIIQNTIVNVFHKIPYKELFLEQ